MKQEDLLRWMVRAHVVSETSLNPGLSAAEFEEKMTASMKRYACGPEKIAFRWTSFGDYLLEDLEAMQLFRFDQRASGPVLEERMAAYQVAAAEGLERLFEDVNKAPGDLIHVSCTGYVSPSVAQNFVAGAGWGGLTRVTHAYQMGCYAAFPALRIAEGLVAARDVRRGRADIAHTELCTLHLNPTLHTPDRLIIQSLFGDGLIRYSVLGDDSPNREPGALELLASHEEIIPGTAGAMSWIPSESAIEMTLARNVPELIAASLPGFLEHLLSQAGLSWESLRRGGVFAIHPGGPRILDEIQSVFGIEDAQLAASREVLLERGNMSSATIPHIWQKISTDPRISAGTPILSLAFGPGLSICGAVLRKS
ncbi:MAG: 3-oxoacyl-[acyl-carrier-protein] synthase III C-terminal domain-containing protein [Bdellovibrionota bacterium]